MQINPPSALPEAPCNAKITVVKATYVEIKWERRSPDYVDSNSFMIIYDQSIT